MRAASRREGDSRGAAAVWRTFYGNSDRVALRSAGMEEVLPPQTENGAGFEPTRVRQFTVFLENRVGRLGTLVRALEETSGRVCALSIEESADSALVRLICADPDASRESLHEAGFSFSETDV